MISRTDGINTVNGNGSTVETDRIPSVNDYKRLERLINRTRASSLSDGTIEILIGFFYCFMAAEEFIVLKLGITNDQFGQFALLLGLVVMVPFLIWTVYKAMKRGFVSQLIFPAIFIILFLAIIMVGKAINFLYAPLVAYLTLSLGILYLAKLWRGWVYVTCSIIAFFLATHIVQNSAYMSHALIFYARTVSLILFFGFMFVIGLISFIQYLITNGGLPASNRTTDGKESEPGETR